MFYEPTPTLCQLHTWTLALFDELHNNIVAERNKGGLGWSLLEIKAPSNAPLEMPAAWSSRRSMVKLPVASVFGIPHSWEPRVTNARCSQTRSWVSVQKLHG
jgi:hypothetical protein